MSYTVDLLNRSTLTKIKEIEIVNEPLIHEEINGSFTLDFEAHYTAKNDLTNDVLVAVDGKYFKIAKVIKSRNDSITLSVHCEHVSYELIIDFELTDEMEYESDAETMIREFLRGTRFNLVYCIPTGIRYYNTKTLDIRNRLFEVADLFGGELIFDNYNISLVEQRGSNKGLSVELGVNLIGVTEEKNFVENKTAYELDLVDLSNVSGYELDFSSAEIGDTITIIDNVLGINTTERIIAIDYNPFKKALPSVTVGDYIRDLTEYLKPEPEEEDEDKEEKGIKSFFKQFKIGGVDMLQPSSDESSGVREYLTNKYLLGVEVNAKYNTLKKELTGIVAEKADGVNGVLSVMQTRLNSSGLMITTITEINSPTQLNSVLIKDVEHITLVISDRSISHYKANPVDAESAEIIAIGICVTFDDGAGVFFEKFDVGNMSLLGLEDLEATENVERHVRNSVMVFPPIAFAEVEIEQKLKGLVVVPQEEYIDWHFTLLHCIGVFAEDGYGVYWNDIERHELPLSNYASFEVVTWEIDSVVVVVSNEPFETILDGTATEDVYFKAFGAKFFMDEIPPDVGGAADYFVEFRIGDVDMLPLASEETDQVKTYMGGDISRVIASATYETTKELTGVFARLKDEYAEYNLHVFNVYLDSDDNSEVDDIFTWVEASSWISNARVPYGGEKKFESFVLVITDLSIEQLRTYQYPETIDNAFIKAFGIKVSMGYDDSDSGEKIFFEYGSCPLSDYMTLEFENGPYTEVRSITTGIEFRQTQALPTSLPSTTESTTMSTPTTRDVEGMPNITIIVSQERNFWNGTITGLTANSSYPYLQDVYVNFQAVCVKGYIPPPGDEK